MSKLSRAALVALLLMGGSSIALTVPADAAKKKEEAPKGPDLSPEFRKVAKPAQDAITAKDYATAEPLLVQAEAAATTPADKHYALVFRFQVESGKLEAKSAGDQTIYRQGEAALIPRLDALIADPLTEPKIAASLLLRRGLIAYDSKQYAESVTYFTKSRDLGETNPDLPLQIVKAYIEGGNLEAGAADMRKLLAAEKAAGKQSPEAYYDYIIPRLVNAGKTADFISWSEEKLRAYPSPKNWRSLVGYYGLFGKRADLFDKQQKIDMFRLLRANKALADLADYGQFAQYLRDAGLATEAKAVLDEGVATGKMQLTRADDKELYASSVQAIKAYGSNAAHDAEARAAKDGVSANASANVYLGEGNYAKAIEFYKIAQDKCTALSDAAAQGKGTAADKAIVAKCTGRSDEIATRLGIAYALSGDKPSALAAFGTVKEEKRRQIAMFWEAWVNMSA